MRGVNPIKSHHSPHNARHHPHDDLIDDGEELDDDAGLLAQRPQHGAEDDAEEDDAQRVGAGPVLDRAAHQLLGQVRGGVFDRLVDGLSLQGWCWLVSDGVGVSDRGWGGGGRGLAEMGRKWG